MLIINNKIIKGHKQCTIFIKNNIITSVQDEENKIENYYKIKYNILDKVNFLNNFKKFLYKKNTFILFINSNDINNNFDLKRLKKFIEYVTNNNKDRVSDTYLKLRYGYLNTKDRDKRSISLKNYIKKYGKVVGTKKYNKNIETQKNASKRTLKYWLNLYNDKDIAKQKLKEFQQSHIKTHFKNKTQKYIDNYNKENSPWNVEFYIKKGYNKNEAKEIICNIKKDSSKFCVEHYLNRGYNKNDAIKLKSEFWLNNCHNNGTNISKASLKQFKEILKYLKKYNNNNNNNICVYYGNTDENKKEYFLYDKINKQYYFYDLTILYGDIKIIIEYHGNMFHPNKDKLTTKEWNDWKCLFNESLDADTKYKYDKIKKDVAITNGFKYLEIWDNDNFKENNNKIKRFLINNGLYLK